MWVFPCPNHLHQMCIGRTSTFSAADLPSRWCSATKQKRAKVTKILVLFIFFLNKTKRMVLILRIVYNEGFSINPEKTRVARSNARQEVTGIVVNSHMQISKEKRKQIRQQIYYIRKYGLESHLERIEENRANYLNHLLGQINFALFVNPRTKKWKNILIQ